MRRVAIGSGLALVAAFIWLAASAPPTKDEGDSVKPAAASTPGNGKPADAAKPAPTHPANWVETLPPLKGSARDGSLSYPSHAKEVEGGIEHLDGVVRTYDIAKSVYRQGADSILELSVEGGKARAYLEYFPDTGSIFRHQDGYVFAEAAAGAPGKVEGLLAWGGGSGDHETYAVTFESLGGEATRLRYKIVPRR
jgi:hypothetical protein